MIIEAREDTITLRGAIKSNIWPAIQAAAALLLENHPTGIIIDCSPLTRITAKGAETFADAFSYIHSHNASIVVAGLRPDLVEIGKAVPGVRSQLPLAKTVEDARATLRLQERELARGKARFAAVVPIVGNWRRAVYLADKLAIGENCEIHLVDLIKVPHTLPLGTPLPQREAEGQARLEAAAQAVKSMRLRSYSHVERVRAESTGLAEFIERLHASFTVVSIDRLGRQEPYLDTSEAMSLFESVGCEVSLVKNAPAEIPADRPKRVLVPAVGAWEHALEHACKIMAREQAQIRVVCPIVVPRTEPLDAPQPDAEAAASDCAREAQHIGREHGFRVETSVDKVRDQVLGLLRVADEQRCDLAVVGVRRETTGNYHIARAVATAFMQSDKWETVFLRVGDAATG